MSRSSTADARRKPKVSEHEVQSAILDYLEVHRIFHWRQNVGGMKKGKHFVRFGTKGLPDICCILFGGKFMGIEVKAVGEEQSQAQVQFQVSCEKAHARYVLATDLQHVIDAITDEWQKFVAIAKNGRAG